MTYPRKSLVCLEQTPYYHVIARCVRRAWLWGLDQYSGKDYSHRKSWVLARLEHLSRVFAIDICAYAIMSNHYHLVVHVDQARTRAWTAKEIVARWTQLFSRPVVIRRWEEGLAGEAEAAAAALLVEEWRKRLCDLSWYMRCLNEHLARLANAEDECTGRFWEGRFKSQALLDEAGLLTAMAYVDLNPIRAGIAEAPEEADFTSIRARIERLARIGREQTETASRSFEVPLLDFCGEQSCLAAAVPFDLQEYLALVDWSGRAVRDGSRGVVDPNRPAILARLNIDPEAWQEAMRPRGIVFGRALGQLDHLRLHAKALGQAWIRGLRQAERLYRAPVPAG